MGKEIGRWNGMRREGNGSGTCKGSGVLARVI